MVVYMYHNIYGLVKTRKNNAICVSLLAQSIAAPIDCLWLSNNLISYVGTASDAHIVSNLDLIKKLSKLKNITIDYPIILVSFDVKSLFTNVPLEDLIDFMKDHFKECVFPVG